MRPDVKLGVVLSMVVVFVAGGYYLYRDANELPVPVEPGTKALAEASKPKAQTAPAVRSPASRPLPKPVAVKNAPANTSTAPRKEADRQLASGGANADRGATYPVVKPSAKTAGDDRTPPVAQPRQAAKLPSSEKTPPASGTPTAAMGESGPSSTLEERLAQKEKPSEKAIVPPSSSHRSVPLVGTQPVRPAQQPTASARAEDVAVDTHRVQPGDTLSSLASLYYGSERYTQFLIDSNKQLADPNRLKIGETVRIPSRPADAASRRADPAKPTVEPAAAPKGRTYRVQPGDSFYKIAEQSLGDSSRWKELFELNKERVGGDPTRLQVGQELVLPAK